ncbi:hypothetical protein, partial [Vibrio cholerae]|uniref:hypothetical protein n=1 Tax=Vibrio cholerae TaxID=666 RepID=UPI0018F0A759
LLMRVKRALEIALERGYLPEELRRALREQVSLDQLTALLVTGATLGVLERAGLRGVAGWIGIALEAKQDLELLMAWEEFLAACARARSEEEL